MKLYILLFLIAIVFYYLFFPTSSAMEGFDLFGSAPATPPPPPAMASSFSAPSMPGEQSIDFWSSTRLEPTHAKEIKTIMDTLMKGVTGYDNLGPFLRSYYIPQTTEAERLSYIQNKRWPWDPVVQTFYTDVYMQDEKLEPSPFKPYLPVLIPNRGAYNGFKKHDTKNQMLLGLVSDQPNQGPVMEQLYTPDGVSGLFCKTNIGGTPYMTYSEPAKGAADIPTQISGFKFLESECDPCDPFSQNMCKWSMNDAVDPFFAKVWNIPPVELKKSLI
jgi:hypothetical protein